MLKNQLKNYISSNLDVNLMPAISLDRETYLLSYDISLFMNRRLVPEISLFSQICCKPPYSILLTMGSTLSIARFPGKVKLGLGQV